MSAGTRAALRLVLADLRRTVPGGELTEFERLLDSDDLWAPSPAPLSALSEGHKSRWEASLERIGRGLLGLLALAGAARAAWEAWRSGKGQP